MHPGPDLAARGYVESEWAMTGRAGSCEVVAWHEGDRPETRPGPEADYRTRIVVRRPERSEDFSGVVVVEWLNVSAGSETAPDWVYVGEEIVRRGHAWIGLSAQHVAIEGGEAAVTITGAPPPAGLRRRRPERYVELHHPGDAYSYDLLTAVGLGLRDGAPDGPLGELRPETLIAMGESQSAIALTSYLDAVHPEARVYDGFLVHSRAAGALGFDDHGRAADVSRALTAPGVRIRTDLRTPVMVVQTEGDLLGPLEAVHARQDDAEFLRTWEIAGAAHADRFQMGDIGGALGCADPVNAGQQAYVVRAALRALVGWVREGVAPQEMSRLETVPGSEASGAGEAAGAADSAGNRDLPPVEFVRDRVGNARGGVRTPVVEAPVEVLLGDAAPGAPLHCRLFGRTLEADPRVLAELWPDRETYLRAYAEAVERLIVEGVLLDDDREALLADTREGRLEA